MKFKSGNTHQNKNLWQEFQGQVQTWPRRKVRQEVQFISKDIQRKSRKPMQPTQSSWRTQKITPRSLYKDSLWKKR